VARASDIALRTFSAKAVLRRLMRSVQILKNKHKQEVYAEMRSVLHELKKAGAKKLRFSLIVIQFHPTF
jgi:hypothetical protein